MTTLLQKINTEERRNLVLSDYIKIKHGFAFKGEYFSDTPTENILVTPGNFAIGGGFKSHKFKYYDGPVPSEYVLNENDLVVTMTDLSVDADTLGYSALIPRNKKRFLHNQRVGLIQKIKEGIDFGYLYYLMRTRAYQKYVVSTASGSTVKHTSPDRITGYEFEFPSLPIQKKIAEVLSAYDAKIDNNNVIVRNLETMAQTIFNEWFVSFRFPGCEKAKFADSEMGKIPEGWSLKSLGNIAKVTLGGTPSRDKAEYWNGNIPWINSGEVNQLRVVEATEYITELGLKNSNARLMKEGTTLIAITGATLGQVSRLEIESTANQSVVGIYDDQNLLNEYLYLYIKTNILDLISGASGGAQQHINKQMVENYVVLLPDDKIVSSFQKIIQPLFLEISKLLVENLHLKITRDKFIAKLI